MIQQNSWHLTTMRSMEAWIALTSLVFKKPATLSRYSLSQYTEGKLTNLISADALAFLEVSQFLFFWALVPCIFTFSLLSLVMLIGWPFLIGCCILMVNSWTISKIGEVIKNTQIQKNKLADLRVSRINEALQGARTVKLYGWEEVMQRRVGAEREKELACLKRMAMCRMFQQFLSYGVPTLVTVPVFILFERVHGDLPPATIFTAVALFEFFNITLAIIPNLGDSHYTPSPHAPSHHTLPFAWHITRPTPFPNPSLGQ